MIVIGWLLSLFLDLFCRWTVWIKNAQFMSQSSVAHTNLMYAWLSLNKMSSKQLFYEWNIGDLLYIWMFPHVPNVKGKWNSTREPAKYTVPLPLVCFISAWLSQFNTACCMGDENYGPRHKCWARAREGGESCAAKEATPSCLSEIAQDAWDSVMWAWAWHRKCDWGHRYASSGCKRNGALCTESRCVSAAGH